MKKILLFVFGFFTFFAFNKIDSLADDSHYPIDTYYSIGTCTYSYGTDTYYLSSDEVIQSDLIFLKDGETYTLYRWSYLELGYVRYTSPYAFMISYRNGSYWNSLNMNLTNIYSPIFQGLSGSIHLDLPVFDTIPIDKYQPIIIDGGLGYDITLSHTEIKYPFLSTYWEFVSVKGAWNYPNVRELTFDIYVNGVKRDTINKLNNFGTNFGVAFDFFSSRYNVVEGDTIRILCIPLGDGVQGLARGVEWVVGSKENINISKIPNVTPKIEINNGSYTPSIQEERQFIYNPITNEYVTNNYYTQNYESPNLDNIESQLDYIIQYIIDNPISSGSSDPQTIINYNTTNKNYNLNFGDFNLGDIDVDLEIGNAKEHVKQSFDDFITNIQLLMNSPFEKIVIAFGVGIGLVLLVLTIVIVAKILDIIIP